MQFQNTNITGAQMNHYLRQGRLERSLAVRAMIDAAFEGLKRACRALKTHGTPAETRSFAN